MIFFKLHEGFNFWDIFNRKLLSFGWLHSNHYTAFVNIAAILCIYLFIKYKEVWKRILLVLSLFLFLIVEAFTVCRAGILALGKLFKTYYIPSYNNKQPCNTNNYKICT